MIDINELRRKLRSDNLIDHVDIHANVKPVLTELINRLEDAESDALEQARLNGIGSEREAALMAKLEAAEKERDNANAAAAGVALHAGAMQARLEMVEKERDALQAKIEQMEKQEPVALVKWQIGGPVVRIIGDVKPGDILYAIPGAQPEPSEQDASVRKAWARFSHELHRSPDAPYPGMADAFEQHFSQSFIDREWRAEAATWAAAWKAAKRHGAQPAPSIAEQDQINAEAAIRSIYGAQPAPSIKDAIIDDLQSQFDSEGITEHDSGDALIRLSDAIAAVEDNFAGAQPAPSVAEGWQLVPTAESRHPGIYKMLGALHAADNTPGMSEWESYRAMLSEAPEAKP